ncbi:MAG: hypothetical protein AAFP69_18500, partial [Planctomycetota bacterium]
KSDGAGSIETAADYISVRNFVQQRFQSSEINAVSDEQLHWFARPLDCALAIRRFSRVNRGDRVDIIKLMRNQGFDAVRAAGGTMQLGGEGFDVVHQGFVYAPPVTDQPDKYKLAARVLQFPNGAPATPPGWVPADAASVMQMNWNAEPSFWALETMVDEYAGNKNFFRNLITGLGGDANDVRLDIAGTILPNLENQVLIITDNTLPADVSSERSLSALKLKNAAAVRSQIDGWLSKELAARVAKKVGDVIVWDVVPGEPAEENGNDIKDFDDNPFGDFKDDDFSDEDEDTLSDEPPIRPFSVAVLGKESGLMMIGSHPEIVIQSVEKYLAFSNDDSTASDYLADNDLQSLATALSKIAGNSRSIQRFAIPARSWRVKYGLLRQGKLKESDSVLASLIRRATAQADGDEVEIARDKLPPFSEIAPFLSPFGLHVKTEPNGWSLTNLMAK